MLRKGADFEVAARLGWNDQGILLHVDVTDSTPFEETNIDSLYKDDSVELCLMSADKADGMVQLVASPGRTEANPQPRTKILDYRSKAFKKDAPAFTPLLAVQNSARGYSMDLLLPWSSMKIKPEAGTVIGVRFCVNDSDGKVVQRAIWINHQPTAEWMSLAPVRLADKASGPSPIAVWGGY